MKMARSDHFGETVDRATWVRLSLEDVQLARIKLVEVQKANPWNMGPVSIASKYAEKDLLTAQSDCFGDLWRKPFSSASPNKSYVRSETA